jgi:hypothetical protein
MFHAGRCAMERVAAETQLQLSQLEFVTPVLCMDLSACHGSFAPMCVFQ